MKDPQQAARGGCEDDGCGGDSCGEDGYQDGRRKKAGVEWMAGEKLAVRAMAERRSAGARAGAATGEGGCVGAG